MEPELTARLADDLDWNIEAMVRQYQRPVYRFAYRWCGRAHNVEGIAQDAFVKMYVQHPGRIGRM